MKATIYERNSNAAEKYAPALFMTILCSVPSLIPYQEGITPLCFLLLTLVPLIHTIFVTKELDFFDPMVMVSLMYAAGGPLAFIFRDYYENPQTFFYLSHSERSMTWAYRGFASLMSGYFLTKIYANPEKTDNSEYETEYTLIFAKVLGLINIIGLIITLIVHGGVPYSFVESKFTFEPSTGLQVLSYMMQLRYGFFLIYLFLKRYSNDKVLDIIFYIVLLIHIIFIIGAGSKSPMLALLVCIAISVSLTKKQLSLRHFFVGVLAAGVIYVTFQVVTNYRIIIRNTPAYHELSSNFFSSFARQSEIFAEAIVRIFEKHDDYDPTTVVIERFAYITSLEHIFTLTRGESPYLHPIENFMIPLYAFAPRILFKDKPEYLHSGHIAIMSGLSYGGVSVTLIGSFFWAWGYFGVYLGMMFIGVLFAIIVIKSMPPSLHGTRNKVLMISITLALIEPGITFQAITTDLIRIWVFLHLLCFLVTHLNILSELGIRVRYSEKRALR